MADKVQRTPLKAKTTKLIEGVVQGKTIQAAAVEAGFGRSPESASTLATREFKKVEVQQALQQALLDHGIDINLAIAPISKALNAKKVVAIEGDFYQTEVDDIDLQLKGSDRALKLMGVGLSDNASPTFVLIMNNQRDKYGI